MNTFRERAEQLVEQMTLAEKIAQMKYDAPAIERLNVPAYNWWNECLHGVARAGTATVFPQAIGMAASYNTECMERVAEAISDEARAKYNEYKKFGDTQIYQGLTFWSPNINIFRDPRWGRGHETYGEDPYLTGTMGCAFIEGLQGNDPKYRKVDATVKHFAVHSGPEGERHTFDAKVTERDLKETYLWAFKYCIDHADPSAVMGAYNRINGEPSCGSKTYLKKMLYKDWAFDGYVVSDCGAICDFDEHHKITKNKAESAALAVNNGCQLNCGTAYQWLKTAVAAGMITEETISEAVIRLFTARFRLGMFDTDCIYDEIPYEVIDCAEHRKLNKEMAEEGIVLLKNNGILPLKKEMKIAVIGPNATDVSVLLGNYQGTPSHYSTILDGIQKKAENSVLYARGCHIYDAKYHYWQEQPEREALIAAQKSDVILLCMGLNPSMEGEEGDAYNGCGSGDKWDIEIPKSQKVLLEKLTEIGKPIVYVNVSGSCLNLSRPKEVCDAILQVFYPGAEGGDALAEILYGEVCPSGKLPVTFYKSTEQLPDFSSYSMENRTYRYLKEEPLFPFGFGLSYTKFTVTEQEWSGSQVKCIVKNTGDFDGKAVLKVYLKSKGYPELNRQLAGYKKVFLKQNEEKEVVVPICDEWIRQLSVYGELEMEMEV